MKILLTLSALLTLMVLWGMFREVHVYVPKVLTSMGAITQEEDSHQEASGNVGLNHIYANAMASEEVMAVGHERREEKHLLEVLPEQFAFKQPRFRKFGPPRVLGNQKVYSGGEK